MRCADVAMYAAKARGKNRVEVFDPDQHGDLANPRQVEEHLAHAVDRDEIVLQYQPYFALGSDRRVGVEATVHWTHPTLGPMTPAQFIPVAERAGLTSAMSTYILRTASRYASQLDTSSGGPAPRLLLTVTSPQLLEPNFPATVRQTLQETRLEAARLYLGIAESEQLHDAAVQQRLHELATIGVRISLDDLAARQASLATLRSLPINQIKIRPNLDPPGNDQPHTHQELRLTLAIADILDLDTVTSAVDTAEPARAS